MQVKLYGIYEHIEEVARRSYPDECCGVLLGSRSEGSDIVAREFRPLENTAADDRRGRHFQVSPLTLYEVEQDAEKKGLEIVGFYHSHPDCRAVLSTEDKLFMIPDLAYIVTSVVHGEAVETKGFLKFRPDDEPQEIDVVSGNGKEL